MSVIGGFDNRLRIGSHVCLIDSESTTTFSQSDNLCYNLLLFFTDPDKRYEDKTGVLTKISASGKVFIQSELEEVKKYPVSNCLRLEEKPFNPNLLPKTNEIIQMWVALFSISVSKILPRTFRQSFFDGKVSHVSNCAFY